MALYSDAGRRDPDPAWVENLGRPENPNFAWVADEKGEGGHYRLRAPQKPKSAARCVFCDWEAKPMTRQQDRLGVSRVKGLSGDSPRTLMCWPSCDAAEFDGDVPEEAGAQAVEEALLAGPHDAGVHADGRTCSGCVVEKPMRRRAAVKAAQ